ncbi:uncharacterized protein LOC120079078 [Benincasa hispida]|uniref:uncharacterized protein LOC120079078 n=1 Tax=Benincasa hispida TaxID=102211 RepID=UPI00190033DC|nr:uncharacterized protein LOC120079078 [Benincasa hispida]
MNYGDTKLGGTSIIGNERSSRLDYMDCGHLKQHCSPSVDGNEQPVELNEMDRDHRDVHYSTTALVVPPPVSLSHKGELTMPDLTEKEIFTLECAKKLLKNGDEWPAYKAERHAFALVERKIQLLLLSQYGSGSAIWLEKETILNMFSIEEQINQHHAESVTESIYSDKLLEVYQCLCSSGEALKASASPSVQAFCFQRWFLSLRAKVLGTVGSILKLLPNISYFISIDYGKLGINDTVVIHQIMNKFSKLSLTLERLSHEFDLIGTTFIGMDTKSSNIISALALNCSLLAFCIGFACHVPNLATTLMTENVDDFRTKSHAILIQNLIGRLWLVDDETSRMLAQLFEINGGLNNCLQLVSRGQILDVGYEVRGILTLCRYDVSEFIRLQSKSNRVDEGTFPQVIGDGVRFLSNILTQCIRIPLRVPKCFFCVRPCIGSHLFATTDARKLDEISIPFGFQLSLNICLQLKNIASNMPVQITKMYCILYCDLSFQKLKHNGKNMQKHQVYEAWENGDIVEMHNKLLHYSLSYQKNHSLIQLNVDAEPKFVDLWEALSLLKDGVWNGWGGDGFLATTRDSDENCSWNSNSSVENKWL